MSKEIKNDNVILAKTKHRIRSIVEQPTEIHPRPSVRSVVEISSTPQTTDRVKCCCHSSLNFQLRLQPYGLVKKIQRVTIEIMM